MDWKSDSDLLRKRIREEKPTGSKATFLYVLISHMRGKIHMRYDNKYHGGWRGWKAEPKREEIPKEFYTAYGRDDALQFYNGSVIENLADQEEWIRRFYEGCYKSDKVMFELVERVIRGYNEEEAMVA